jgi:hypothetical protein
MAAAGANRSAGPGWGSGQDYGVPGAVPSPSKSEIKIMGLHDECRAAAHLAQPNLSDTVAFFISHHSDINSLYQWSSLHEPSTDQIKP